MTDLNAFGAQNREAQQRFVRQQTIMRGHEGRQTQIVSSIREGGIQLCTDSYLAGGPVI